MYLTFVSLFESSIAKSRDEHSEQLLSRSNPKLMILKDSILTPSEIKQFNPAQIEFLALPFTHINEWINWAKQVASDFLANGYHTMNDELIASKTFQSLVYKVGDNIFLQNQHS